MNKEDILEHYGVKRRSGRYPWGSGETPYQHEVWFLSYISDMEKKGLSQVEIAKSLGINTTQLRAKKAIARNEVNKSEMAEAYRLKEKGYSNTEIGRRMGKNESSIRLLLDPSRKAKAEVLDATADVLKKAVEQQKYIDIGKGSEKHLGISSTKMKNAVAILQEQGYTVHQVKIPQLGTNNLTTMLVLAAPNTEWKEVYDHKDEIGLANMAYSEDRGHTYHYLKPPVSVNSNRLLINYAETGGTDKDGVIELRRGVDDLSLGQSRYAQVRIAVDGKSYLKGMAMYADDLPDGVDIRFNTNKHEGTPMDKVLKPLKNDPNNPFGASISRQVEYSDAQGNKHQSPLNIVNEEGTWEKWSRNLASQFLSKQPVMLAKKQLELTYSEKKDELEEIESLTNPVIKKKLLQSFADDCDSSAKHLKAAALPRQATHVILPFPDISDKEVYAPNYRDGEEVILVRYPHGGTFEIPRLTVNNRLKSAKNLIQNARDAIGINPKTAEQLSGADFDGDTVIVIPTKNIKVKTSAPLEGLKDFDPKAAYPLPDDAPRMSSRKKGIEMGIVSNLITDMTIKGATSDEICRAVRHSMVVIDAEKHHLDYKQSAIDNGIAELKRKYQTDPETGKAGASTLISRAKNPVQVPKRKAYTKIDPETGEKIYLPTGETYKVKTVNKRTGEVVEKIIPRTSESTQMDEAKDAFTLSSGTPIETVYATHANRLKALGNRARKEYLDTKPMVYSPSANVAYKNEVNSLMTKLNAAQKNAPLERKAQAIANKKVQAQKEENPDMDNNDLKKIKGLALTEARIQVGAKKPFIEISDSEWKAIQAGAISNNRLTEIINNADLDRIKEMATPRASSSMSVTRIARAKAMLDAGYTRAEVADQLGISVSTLNKNLGEGD